MRIFARTILTLTFAVLSMSAAVHAQQTQPPTSTQTAPPTQPGRQRIAAGSRVFIATMEGGLHTFITAEMVKEHLPVTLVTDEASADYIINGAAIAGEDRWYHSVFGTGRDRNEGSIQVVRVADRTVIWAGEAGDRSLLWGNLRRGGRRRIADRLVDQMKRDLF